MPATGLRGPSGWVFRGSPFRAWFVAFFLCWGAMNIIALAVERRTDMLRNHDQYKALYWGSSICLPLVAVGIWYLGRLKRRRPNLTYKWQWHAFCFACGLAYGVWWHLVKEPSYHFYTRSQMWSPTKLYNDFVVFPLYIYLLASAGLPAFGPPSEWKRGWKTRLGIVVLMAAWELLNIYDSLHRPHHGHVNFDWGQFWGRFGL